MIVIIQCDQYCLKCKKLYMIRSFSKLSIKNKKTFSIGLNIPMFNFILGRMFKKQKPQDIKEAQEQAKMQAQLYEAQKKKMKKQVEMETQYDFLQRQKDIELNKDFRKYQQKYKNTIPQDIGKAGFNQLVYWSQNAHTPQQITDLIKKFNNTSRPKQVEDQHAFQIFKENVKATVYLAQTYPIMVDYAHFAYKYQILQPQFWLKIQQKVIRKTPKTNEQIDQLIDIVFVMGNVGQGEIIFSSSQVILSNKIFTVEQIAKLIIAFFKTSKGQKEWVAKLLASLQMQMNEATCDVLESILPILKHSKNIPYSFDQKLQMRVQEIKDELNLSLICVISQYLGFQKGSANTWTILQSKAREKISKIKSQRGKIPTSSISQIITGILSSYKFSTQFVVDLIIPQLKAKQFKVLYRLPATVLSTLSKCLYIYELEGNTVMIEQNIQGLIMRKFQKIEEVTNQELVHVLKDYTVTRLGTRQFYLFLESIVNDKLQDIKTDKYSIQSLTAIYMQSNLCSTDTLDLLKGMAYQ